MSAKKQTMSPAKQTGHKSNRNGNRNRLPPATTAAAAVRVAAMKESGEGR
jgi:hypothetical protein